MCFLGLFCSEDQASQSDAAGALTNQLNGNTNSTFLLETIFDLRESHATHFGDIKMLLIGLLLVTIIGMLFSAIWMYQRCHRERRRREEATLQSILSQSYKYREPSTAVSRSVCT